MKIERLYEPAMTIEQFAEKYDLTMVIGRYRGGYTAEFEGVEISDGGLLRSIASDGETEEEAIDNYADLIEGQVLVLGAAGPDRREIQVPELIV